MENTLNELMELQKEQALINDDKAAQDKADELKNKSAKLMAEVTGKNEKEKEALEKEAVNDNQKDLKQIIHDFEETQANQNKFSHPILNRRFFLSLLGVIIGVLVAKYAVEPAVRVKSVYTNNPNDFTPILEEVIPKTA